MGGVAFAVALFFALALTQSGLQQDDPYHLAIAEILGRGEILRALPWAKHTVLAERFADLHFGYHVSLVPFVAVLGAMGAKLATALGVVAMSLVVVGIVGREHPLRAALPFIVLFASGDFLLRAMGMRPIAWGAAAVLVVIPLARAERFALLGLVGAVFAWSYAAFPLLALPLAAHAIVRAFIARELAWRPTASVLLGVMAGLCLHPNFPTILDVLRVQLFDVSLEGSGHNLEFSAPGLALFFEQSGLAFITMIVGGWYAWRAAPEHREALLAWALLAVLSCALAFRHHRGVDTFVPVAVTFFAVASGHARTRVPMPRTAVVCAGLVFAIVGGVYARQAWSHSRAFEAIDPSACTTWLARNSAPGDEVFINDYGAFPRLFYFDRENVYTLGLEPAFMRAKDPALFERYVAAIRLEEDPYPLIAETLGARYVYVENTRLGRPFHAYLEAHGSQYRAVYRDDFASVFAVRRRR